MKNKTENKPHLCPCESGKTYNLCCQPYIEQNRDAPTAEALMRSRYTSFVLLNEDYLRYSWHPDTCPQDLQLDKNTEWLGLRIKKTEQGQKNNAVGYVEFVARYKINGKGFRLHETSQFIRINNRWVYLNGDISD